MQVGWGLWYSSFPLKTTRRSNRAAWVGILVCAIVFQFAQFGRAQTSAWDPGLPKDLFKDDLTPKDPKNAKKPQKPIHRLAPTTCDDCQKIVDQLQNALDDWYALELADANDTIKKSVAGEKTDVSQADARAQKEDALAGLGQKERPPPKGKTKADVKKEIKKLSDALQECLKKCAPTPTPTETPTPTPTPEEKNEVPPPPVFDIVVPKLPPCFDTERDREKYRQDLEEILKKLELVFKKYDQQLFKPPNQAWQDFKEKFQKAKAEVSDQNLPGDDGKDKIDKVPVPCKKTATGGGQGKTPTPKPGKPKAPRVTTGHNVSFDDGGAGLSEDFCALISENKIRIDDTFGTGETIGHVADLVIENLTDQPIEVTIPPMVLESRSGKNQHYGSRGGETVEVPPHEKKKVPLYGVCLARNKPPVSKGVGGDLAINDCDPDAHIGHDDAHRMMRIAESKYEAADKLEEEGKLKDMPYRDPKKRKDIVVQWSTWADPRISEVTGAPPATKDDLKKTVYKQAEEQGPVTPDKKKKLDDGIDTLWDKIELTTKKAKDLEKQPPEEETTPAVPSGTGENVSNDTPTPAPQTQEKKKKIGKNKKKKKYPKQIQDWVDKYNAAQDAEDHRKNVKDYHYDSLKKKYFEQSKHHGELEKARDEAKKKADAPGATPQDKNDYDKAQKELDENEKALEKDFQQTEDGKKALDEYQQAEKDAKNAQGEAKKAEDKLPPGIDKDEIKKAEDEEKTTKESTW